MLAVSSGEAFSFSIASVKGSKDAVFRRIDRRSRGVYFTYPTHLYSIRLSFPSMSRFGSGRIVNRELDIAFGCLWGSVSAKGPCKPRCRMHQT